MKQVLIKSGKITLEEVPAPEIAPGFLLVENCYSFISTGTELAGLSQPASPFQLLLKRPALLATAFASLKNIGLLFIGFTKSAYLS